MREKGGDPTVLLAVRDWLRFLLLVFFSVVDKIMYCNEDFNQESQSLSSVNAR